MKVYIKDLFKLKPIPFNNYQIYSDGLNTNQTLDNIYNYRFNIDKEVYVFNTTTYNSRFQSKMEMNMDISFANMFNNIDILTDNHLKMIVSNGIYFSV